MFSNGKKAWTEVGLFDAVFQGRFGRCVVVRETKRGGRPKRCVEYTLEKRGEQKVARVNPALARGALKDACWH